VLGGGVVFILYALWLFTLVWNVGLFAASEHLKCDRPLVTFLLLQGCFIVCNVLLQKRYVNNLAPSNSHICPGTPSTLMQNVDVLLNVCDWFIIGSTSIYVRDYSRCFLFFSSALSQR